MPEHGRNVHQVITLAVQLDRKRAPGRLGAAVLDASVDMQARDVGTKAHEKSHLVRWLRQGSMVVNTRREKAAQTLGRTCAALFIF